MIAVSRRLAALRSVAGGNYLSRAAGVHQGWVKKLIFQISCSMAQKVEGGSGNHGKTNRASRSGGLAEFRPIPGRLGTHLRCTLADGGERGRGVDQRLEASLRCCRVTPRARGKAPQQTQWGYVRDRSGPQGRSRRGRSVGRWGPGAEGSGSDAPSTREPTDCHPQMFLTRRRRVVRAVQVTKLPVANRPPTRSSRGCGTPAALSAR